MPLSTFRPHNRGPGTHHARKRPRLLIALSGVSLIIVLLNISKASSSRREIIAASGEDAARKQDTVPKHRTLTVGADADADAVLPTFSPATANTRAPFFTCRDDRRGLHVVHSRFLVGQRANATFIASRLMLLHTFLVPSLNAQTAKDFFLLISHDDQLSRDAIGSLRSTLGHLTVPWALHAQPTSTVGRGANTAVLTHYSMMAALNRSRLLPEVKPSKRHLETALLDLYVTSRIDGDDAVHFGAVHAMQKLACSCQKNSKSALVVSYPRPGLLWNPALNNENNSRGSENGSYGFVAANEPTVKYLAILQTMIMQPVLMPRCGMNVYSHQHHEPYLLCRGHAKTADCPFDFPCAKNIVIWDAPNKEPASLYVRTGTSSTWNKTKGGERTPADATKLHNWFGIDPSTLSLANTMLGGLEGEASDLLHAKAANKWRRQKLFF